MRILLAAFKQETATFNPARSTREHFKIVRGADLLALSDTRSELGGALTRLAEAGVEVVPCLLYTSPSPRDKRQSRMPSSA